MSSPSPIVRCVGEGCHKQVRRSQAWQRFVLLRFLGKTGGGRQLTKAGCGEDVYYCSSCALREDLKVHGLLPTDSLFGDV